MGNTENLSYCVAQVRAFDRDRFLSALFVPADKREALLAVYALNVELMRIPATVSEEMIGHIRYAWWQESVEKLYTGTAPLGQPVLEALKPVIARIPQEKIARLLAEYREHYPAPPCDVAPIMEDLSLSLLDSEFAKGWQKAHNIIAKHRKRYGKKLNSWLMLKLLIAGM